MFSFKKIYLALFVALIPSFSFAHVKWFVDSEEIISNLDGSTTFYNWTSKEALIWSGIVLVTVLIFSIIDQHIKEPKKLLKFGLKNKNKIDKISQIILGLFLISVSFLWNIILVPEAVVNSPIMTTLMIAQVIIGCMYVFNIKPRIASVVLIFMIFGMMFDQGIVMLIENAMLLALAVYFLVIHSKKDSWLFCKLNKHAIEIVRIGTGISLVMLAFTEKLIYPELSLKFLEVHQWNFMSEIFPWFTDNLFVLSTGYAEMIFGILFIMGYLTRTTTVLIAVFFALSVITMMVQFGAWEVEDLVVYSAAILMLFHGHGRTKFFHFKWPQHLSFFNRSIFKR